MSALDIPSDHFHAATVRWGLMYMTVPVAALANVERALLPTGLLVAALWAEPERVAYDTLPRRLLQRSRVVPPIDAGAPGAFYYADLEEDEQRAWETDLTCEVRRHGGGSLRLGGVTRIVRAHKSARGTAIIG